MINCTLRTNLIFSYPVGPAASLTVDNPLREIFITSSTAGDSYIIYDDTKLKFFNQGWEKLTIPSGIYIKDDGSDLSIYDASDNKLFSITGGKSISYVNGEMVIKNDSDTTISIL